MLTVVSLLGLASFFLSFFQHKCPPSLSVSKSVARSGAFPCAPCYRLFRARYVSPLKKRCACNIQCLYLSTLLPLGLGWFTSCSCIAALIKSGGHLTRLSSTFLRPLLKKRRRAAAIEVNSGGQRDFVYEKENNRNERGN